MGTESIIMKPSKKNFLDLVRQECLLRYEWAKKDSKKLEKYIDGIRESIYTEKRESLVDGPSCIAACKAMGIDKKPTYKLLRKLPEE